MAHWTDRLSEYLDDELTRDERTACDAHLASCGECRTVLADLQSLVRMARADAESVPATDQWPGILHGIGTLKARPSSLATSESSMPSPVARPEGQAFKPRSRWQITFTVPQLALAASLLIAVSAGVAYLAAGRVTTRPTDQEDPIQAQAETLLPASATIERANFADVQFDQAVADLEKVLIERRDELDPRTIIVIERNLAAIDQAIREARAALDADPANTFLNSHLADARRKKLELLRQATMLQSSSGD
jgi:hypothetical protein